MSTSDGLLRKANNGWLIGLAGVAAILVVFATSVPRLNRSQIAANRAHEFASQEPVAEFYQAVPDQGRIHSAAVASISTELEPASAKAAVDSPMDRKMVRTSSMYLIVQKPGEASERIRALAEGMGGFLVSSDISGGQDASGSLTIRVPAAKFEEARAEIRKLGLRIESEKVEAQDVTRQYVDQEANLRNLRAEEAQYLAILRQAHTVKDTLEVSEKLSEVRGQIEQQQAEFDALSKQIETVALSISLRAEAEAQVFGLHWRPLYQLKLALRDGLDAVAGYAAAMISIAFYLPAVLLWLITIVVGAALGWKVLRWAARMFFAWPKQPAEQNG
ncbi:MAG: DUF4349 domain-containing protein [Candidatus Sulfotelmatobacter sp.]